MLEVEKIKRIGNLYSNLLKFENINSVFNEVCRNTKNKAKANRFKEYKCINIFKAHEVLKNKVYVPGPNYVFNVYEPKKRRVVSQQMFDKLINHLVARYILMPAVIPCLIDSNVASRPGMGTSAGLKFYYKYRKICKIKYGKFYILKCDIKKFFASINHDLLKQKLMHRIKDKDALKIVFDIIDTDEQGLSIGSMTSQILAIFYLNDFDHFVKEDLKIKYYVRYQDDFLLFHFSKEYLKECLKKIDKFLRSERLELNKKTRIYTSENNFVYLGRNVCGMYGKRREVLRKLKKRQFLYSNGEIGLYAYMGAVNNFENAMASQSSLRKQN